MFMDFVFISCPETNTVVCPEYSMKWQYKIGGTRRDLKVDVLPLLKKVNYYGVNREKNLSIHDCAKDGIREHRYFL